MAHLYPPEIAALASNPWFAALPAEIREALIASGARQDLAQGEALYQAGDISDAIFAVLDGGIKSVSFSEEGRESILGIHPPGDWIGDPAVFAGVARTYTARAHIPSIVLRLAAATLDELLLKYPRLARAFLAHANRNLVFLMRAFDGFAHYSLKERFAGRLVSFADAFGRETDNGILIDIPLTEETCARLSAASRQRMSQLLQEMKREGLIEHRYGRVTIKDRPRLLALAQNITGFW